jgi:hypothetical protein
MALDDILNVLEVSYPEKNVTDPPANVASRNPSGSSRDRNKATKLRRPSRIEVRLSKIETTAADARDVIPTDKAASANANNKALPFEPRKTSPSVQRVSWKNSKQMLSINRTQNRRIRYRPHDVRTRSNGISAAGSRPVSCGTSVLLLAVCSTPATHSLKTEGIQELRYLRRRRSRLRLSPRLRFRASQNCHAVAAA